jgi:hypothetical protein
MNSQHDLRRFVEAPWWFFASLLVENDIDRRLHMYSIIAMILL